MLIAHERGNRYIRRHQCRQCGERSALVLHYHSHTNDDVRCGVCQGEDFEATKSITQRWREDPQSVDIATANRLADKHASEIEEVAAGLPPELGRVVRERFLGLPIPTRGEE